ncbi:MAG: ectonucleotide pyrophosphatase/phosphodiesterase [Clostridiales bacterium]|nr:ectonucleotide pyrophosphatase/phosphodiesterase [Clostridiales bacterium]
MKRLFVLSLDSLFYDDREWLRECPYLYEIWGNGSWVKEVQSVYPAMTYAAHATMLTGCYPDVHGIYHNEKIQVGRCYPDWHWRREELKVSTLIDAAQPLGYRFCVVNWPVTGGDPNIAYNIPEIWLETPEGDSRPRFLTVCSDGMEKLYDKYRGVLRWKYQPELDEFGVRCLQDVIEEHQPEVVMLHLSYLDHARHAFGGFSEEARQALLACDERFGRIVEQLKRLRLYDETNFVVVGDHGHLPVKQVFHPNVILREHGLIENEKDGSICRWKAYCHSAGLSCHVVLADPSDTGTRAYVEKLLQEMVCDERLGCEEILDAKMLKDQWHLSGPFDYVIEGRPGTSFGGECTGNLLTSANNRDYKISVSGHGHMPVKGPQPTFFLSGPQVKQGVVIERGRLIDEAPTWASILGVSMPEAQGISLNELLRDPIEIKK